MNGFNSDSVDVAGPDLKARVTRVVLLRGLAKASMF